MVDNSSNQRPISSQANSAREKTDADMLHIVLDAAQPYPWLPTDPAAQAYLDEVAAAGDALDITDGEAIEGWQALSTQLESMWTTPSQVPASPTSAELQDRLREKFAQRLPASLVQQISAKAQQVMASGRPMAEQLIACVQDTLTAWDETDLQVMARPLAYAMRGQEEILEVTIQSVRNAEWEALSPMEQARISLAAARYAIDCLKDVDA
ncbi:MAG: hypothetical protein AAFZ80_09980 [Cyanobacteria bacterium P01_A01_bin.105]